MKYVISLISLMITLSACYSQKGDRGIVGNTGPAGQNGTPGIDGSSCTVTALVADPSADPNGGSLISCPDGTSSMVLNGSDGAAGHDGQPGTVITPVQFCPNQTTYPSTFSEIGFCINNTLWAVYSLNDGFLTEIPPGTYSSDGVNSSCIFTVKDNCEVDN